MSLAVAFIRLCFPESAQFIEAKTNGKQGSAKDFWKEVRVMMKNEWRICIYCCIMMTWFNFYRFAAPR
jgi:hypothetical protein